MLGSTMLTTGRGWRRKAGKSGLAFSMELRQYKALKLTEGQFEKG
jgi:hypothetical protein